MSYLRTLTNEHIRGDMTRTIPTIGEIHHFIHQGAVFDLSNKITFANSETIYLVGETGATPVHFHGERYTVNKGGFEIRLLEGVTATGGTAATPRNRNRISAKTTTLAVTSGATVTNTGTELYFLGIPGSTVPAFQSPQAGAEVIEWILKPNTKYAIELKNLDAEAKTMYVAFSWYEVGLID